MNGTKISSNIFLKTKTKKNVDFKGLTKLAFIIFKSVYIVIHNAKLIVCPFLLTVAMLEE